MSFNDNPKLSFPCREENVKNVCWFRCLSSEISLTVTTPKTGYFVGQTIPLDIIIDNKTKIQINQVLVYLVKSTTYTSMSPKKRIMEDWNVVDRIPFDKNIKNEMEHFKVNFIIPQTNPSIARKIIEISYEIMVEAKVRDLWRKQAEKLS